MPYHEDLPFQKKYGVNTDDTDFKVIKASYASSCLPANYTFKIYGYQFSKGECCKKYLNINCKEVPCYNAYSTPIVAPDGSTKHFCPGHVRQEVKTFKFEIKKKAIEDKLIKKQKAAEEKALKKQKALDEKEKKKAEVKEPNVICVPCMALIKTGPRKGEACNQKSNSENNLCKRHQPK